LRPSPLSSGGRNPRSALKSPTSADAEEAGAGDEAPGRAVKSALPTGTAPTFAAGAFDGTPWSRNPSRVASQEHMPLPNTTESTLRTAASASPTVFGRTSADGGSPQPRAIADQRRRHTTHARSSSESVGRRGQLASRLSSLVVPPSMRRAGTAMTVPDAQTRLVPAPVASDAEVEP
jgi:hypothetical protein